MLRSDLCEYGDSYIVVKGRISVTETNNANKRDNKLTFKSNAPCRSWMSKINNIFVDNAEDLDIAMPMDNLLEYSSNYSMASGSCKSVKYKTKITVKTPVNTSRLNAEIVVPSKYFSNFWRSLDWLLINCEIELDLSCSKECIIYEISKTPAVREII